MTDIAKDYLLDTWRQHSLDIRISDRKIRKKGQKDIITAL